MQTAFINSFPYDRRLFRSEIRAALAHADGLFRAGILTRQETERVKNGLWTILKRGEVDRNFFDAPVSPDVFSFVEARLFQLINESAARLQIGRSREHQAALALRIWLRDEIVQIVELLEHLEVILQNSKNPIFAAFFEMFDRDREIFGEVLRRTNRLPHVNWESDEALAEIDFNEIARDLGFDSVTHNALESASDRDFCLEFVGAANFGMLHLTHLAGEILRSQRVLSDEAAASLQIMRGKSARIFGHYAALYSLLKTAAPLAPAGDLREIYPIVFETADVVNSCLKVTLSVLPNFTE